MKVIRYSILLLIIATIISCSNEPKRPQAIVTTQQSTNNENVKVTTETVAVEPEQSTDTTPRDALILKVKVKDPKEISKYRASALNILNFRIKNDATSYALVEADTWQYEFVYDGKMSAPGVYSGVWVDFRPDHTYAYGKNGKLNGTGKYNYHLDRSELLMIDDNSAKKPREWSVKSAEDVLILIGTETYKDNHIQMKLSKVPDSIQQ